MVCISYISYHSDSEQQEKKNNAPLVLRDINLSS